MTDEQQHQLRLEVRARYFERHHVEMPLSVADLPFSDKQLRDGYKQLSGEKLR